MKNFFYRYLPFLSGFLLIFFTDCVTAQCTITSSDSYGVEIEITPKRVLVPADCPWGYNYTIEVDYDAKFSGTNIPWSLYTLQGFLKCGSVEHYFDMNNAGGTGTTQSSSSWRNFSDCKSIDLIDLDCNTVRIEIQGSGLPLQSFNCAVYSPLPIELEAFHALEIGGEVIFSWTTASETNNDFFTIQRSADAVHWENLIQVDGSGNSSVPLHYEATDANPLPGISYYRLKQTDFNGDYSYSEIKAVTFDQMRTEMRIYPNPASDVLIIEGSEKELELIRIYSVTGQDVTRLTEVVGSGSNKLILNIRHLSCGSYILKAGVSSERFSKL